MEKHPLADCENCPLQKARYCPSVGPQDADIVIVGEAPGREEVRQGEPFVGISGKLLNAVLKENQIDRSEVFLTNVVACRPRGNDDPPQEAVTACAPRLEAEIKERNPDYIVAAGNFAATSILGYKTKITKDRIGPPKDSERFPGTKVIPTIHPAACLRAHDHFPNLCTDFTKIKAATTVKWEPPDYKVIENPTQAQIALAQIINSGAPVAIDLEVGVDKDDTYNHPEVLTACGIAYQAGKVLVLGQEALKANGVRRKLGKLATGEVTYHNGKYDTGVFHSLGILRYGKTAFDTILASYALDERSGTHSLDYLSTELLGTPNWKKEFKELGGFKGAPPEALYRYNAYDVGTTYDLRELQTPQLREQGLLRLKDLLLRASDMLMVVEHEGIGIDLDILDEQDRKLSAYVDEQTKVLHDLTGTEFNPNSPQQVQRILEEKYKIKTKTTKEDMLLKLRGRGADEFITQLLEYRGRQKLHGTYVKGIRKRLENGRIRTTFKIHGTVTGRLSSVNPNLQNQPRVGGIREMFIPADGNVFIYGDYKNIEGRVVAVLADARSLVDMFQKGIDVHNITAERFFGPAFTKEQRVIAKSITHGLNYARTAHGIASDGEVDLSMPEIEAFVDFYKQMVPEVFEWHEQVKEIVFNSDDHLRTPFGRKRRYSLITNDNIEDITKEAIAFQPQSIGSDITLEAGIVLHSTGYRVRVLVHDGILIEVPKDEAEEAAKDIKRLMEHTAKEAYTDYVPFPVDISIGNNWGEV